MSNETVVQQGQTALAVVSKEDLAADAARFSVPAARINTKAGRLTIDGQQVKDNVLDVVVIEAVLGKAYYEGDYDPSTPQAPVCYAFHPNDPKKMEPHEAAPKRQHSACATCQHNRFGTAERGGGKRCKDEVRLMCITPSPADGIASVETRMLSVPPGSLKNWGHYVARLRDLGATFRSVVTKVGIEPLKGAYQITFTPAGRLDAAQYEAVKARGEGAIEQAMLPYPDMTTPEGVEPPAEKKAKKY